MPEIHIMLQESKNFTHFAKQLARYLKLEYKTAKTIAKELIR